MTTLDSQQYPPVVALDADSVARLLSSGYKLMLVNRRLCVPEGKFTFTVPVARANVVCTVHLRIFTDMHADFKVFHEERIPQDAMAAFCREVLHETRFEDIREGWLREMAEAGLADGDSTIAGGVLFVHAQRLHLFAALELIARWSRLVSGIDSPETNEKQ